MLTPDESSFVDTMTGNVEYWRRIHSGLVTPTGRPKKVPWFLIVRCVKGHMGITNMKRSVGMRFRCQKHGFRPGKGTIQCEHQVEIIEIDDMENRLGISKEEADDIHTTWKESHT